MHTLALERLAIFTNYVVILVTCSMEDMVKFFIHNSITIVELRSYGYHRRCQQHGYLHVMATSIMKGLLVTVQSMDYSYPCCTPALTQVCALANTCTLSHAGVTGRPPSACCLHLCMARSGIYLTNECNGKVVLDLGVLSTIYISIEFCILAPFQRSHELEEFKLPLNGF